MSLVNCSQVAQALNLTQRRVQQLVGEGMPRAARGKYDLGTCMLWYIRHLQALLEKRGPACNGTPSDPLEQQRIRVASIDAELKELELGRRRGELVPVGEAEKANFAAGRKCRDSLLAIPARLGPIVAGSLDALDCERLILEEVQRACGQLSKDLGVR